MFAALKKAYGDRYLYAGLGPTLKLGLKMGSDVRRGEGPALQEDDLTAFRRLARREDPFGLRANPNVRALFCHVGTAANPG